MKIHCFLSVPHLFTESSLFCIVFSFKFNPKSPSALLMNWGRLEIVGTQWPLHVRSPFIVSDPLLSLVWNLSPGAQEMPWQRVPEPSPKGKHGLLIIMWTAEGKSSTPSSTASPHWWCLPLDHQPDLWAKAHRTRATKQLIASPHVSAPLTAFMAPEATILLLLSLPTDISHLRSLPLPSSLLRFSHFRLGACCRRLLWHVLFPLFFFCGDLKGYGCINIRFCWVWFLQI